MFRKISKRFSFDAKLFYQNQLQFNYKNYQLECLHVSNLTLYAQKKIYGSIN